ncbi:MAG: LLM class flavin-dependent oxidoreductase [Gammaproteobacteria bacterium]|nr:LLM class flavin-dependent oxidoreductase [Gammaproteobacteria bacterium]
MPTPLGSWILPIHFPDPESIGHEPGPAVFRSRLPNTSWDELLRRFQVIEDLGFDLAGTGDHFVDWSNPPRPWFDTWTFLAAVARETTRIRLAPYVAQIPLREPAMLARQALTLDHISGGRLDVGLGIGLEIDPSYDMMGIPDWSVKRYVARSWITCRRTKSPRTKISSTRSTVRT